MRSNRFNTQEYINRYTDVLLRILSMEDPRYAGVNHYQKLHDMVTEHYRRTGRPLTDLEAFLQVKGAAAELAKQFLEKGESFHDLHSGGVFELVEPALAKRLR